MNRSLQAEQTLCMSTAFHTTPCVKAITKEFGPKGFALVSATLSALRQKGTSTLYNEAFVHSIMDFIPDVSYHLVDMVIRKMVKYGWFDSVAFNKRKTLTPPDSFIVDTIDDVFLYCLDRNRPYIFVRGLPISEEKPIFSERIGISSEEIDKTSEKIENNTEYFGNNTNYSVNIQNNTRNILKK